MFFFPRKNRTSVYILGLGLGLGLGFHPAISYALDIKVVDSGPKANQSTKNLNISINTVDKILPRATSNDVMCGKAHHIVRFRMNDTHTGMTFSVTSKKATKVRVLWDHSDKVLFPYPEKNKIIIFPHAGGESRIYVRSHEPLSGNFYITDDQNIVIKTCPYSFLPAKAFRQSVSVNVNETENINDVSNYENNRISVNYRITSKNITPEGGNWSWSIGASQAENTGSSRSINSSFSYSW